ncbi:MAG: 16S rRNA (uracil(1498)-N(3))-methyltransferase [Planctomycetota bacterium]
MPRPLPTLELDLDPARLAPCDVLWLEPPASEIWTHLAKRREGSELSVEPGGTTWRHVFVDPLAVVLARRDAAPSREDVTPSLEIRVALPARPRAMAMLGALRALGVSRVTPVRFSRSLPRRYDPKVLREITARFGAWVSPPLDLDAALADAPLWLEASAREPLPAREPGDMAGNPRALLIGPEGGPTADELERIRLQAFATHTLGRRTMRTETAAVTAGALRLLGRGAPTSP